MNKVINKATWWIFGIMCVSIGLYPVIYFLIDPHFGLLASKTQELLSNQLWNAGFYGHIVLGGVALLIGWTQFSARLRKKRMKLHRTIGKIYVAAALVSGVCGFYIAQFATGGINNTIAFSLSALVWLTSTSLAYTAIRNGRVERHQHFMIYSYAVCFSAVTLRIWLPILTATTGGFSAAYPIVSWLSWVPNVIVAFLIIQNKKRKQIATLS